MPNGERQERVEKVYDGFIRQCLFNRYLIFYVVAALHFIWGVSFFLVHQPIRIPPLIHIWDDVKSPSAVAWLFITISLLSFSVITRRFSNPFIKPIFLLPQQALLIWSALSIISCGIDECIKYPNSLNLGGGMIFIDQLPLLLVTVCHSAALLYNFIFVPFSEGKKPKKDKY